MDDESLRKALVRLAHSRPELRPHLLPILKQGVSIHSGTGIVIATQDKAILHTPQGGNKIDLRADVTGKVPGPGYYTADYIGKGTKISLSKIKPTSKAKLLQKYQKLVEKGTATRPAETGSPGLRGYQRRVNMSRAGQQAALRRAQYMVDLLKKSP